jgi:hypothetical protein
VINLLFILSTIVVLAQKLFFVVHSRILRSTIVVLCVIVLSFSMGRIYQEYVDFDQKIQSRELMIAEQRDMGIRDVKIPPLNIVPTRTLETRELYFRFFMKDLFPIYYGVDSIIFDNEALSVDSYSLDDNIRYNLEVVEHNQNILRVDGWVFIEGVENKHLEKIVLLQDVTGDQEYFYSTSTENRRPDVSEAFNGRYDLSGFFSSIDTSVLPSGFYKIGVVLEYEGQHLAAMSEKQLEVK